MSSRATRPSLDRKLSSDPGGGRPVEASTGGAVVVVVVVVGGSVVVVDVKSGGSVVVVVVVGGRVVVVGGRVVVVVGGRVVVVVVVVVVAGGGPSTNLPFTRTSSISKRLAGAPSSETKRITVCGAANSVMSIQPPDAALTLSIPKSSSSRNVSSVVNDSPASAETWKAILFLRRSSHQIASVEKRDLRLEGSIEVDRSLDAHVSHCKTASAHLEAVSALTVRVAGDRRISLHRAVRLTDLDPIAGELAVLVVAVVVALVELVLVGRPIRPPLPTRIRTG